MPRFGRLDILSPSPVPTHRLEPESLPFAYFDGTAGYFIQPRKPSEPKRRRHSPRYSPISVMMPSRTGKRRCCKTEYCRPPISVSQSTLAAESHETVIAFTAGCG